MSKSTAVKSKQKKIIKEKSFLMQMYGKDCYLGKVME